MRMDPFDILGLDVGYEIDDASLHEKFLEQSTQHHPDRYTDAIEQADAAEKAAAINEAYQALSDPEARANVLLERLGGSTKSDDKSLPPDLLMQMMEIREQQEEAEANDDKEKLAELKQWAETQRAETLDIIAGKFNEADLETNQAAKETLDEIRLQLNALRYYQRMLDQLPE